jgi:hypothetical protein
MSLKAFFLFISAAAVAFAIQTRDEGGQTTSLSETVGEPIVVSRL